MANKLTHADLQQFTGTENWYRHGFFRRILYTDGIKYLAETGGAYWLIDAMASHITGKVLAKKAAADPRLTDMQFWRLKVREDHSAILTCRADSDVPPAIRQVIPFTDFPLSQLDIWACFDGNHWVLCLPAER